MNPLLLRPWPTGPQLRRQRLAAAIPPKRFSLLQKVADEAAARGLPLYLVGGFVRDLLLGHPGLDFDLVVEGDAPGLARALAEKLGGKVTVHTRFKTAQWFPPPAVDLPEFVDFISARSETYPHPGALPKVSPGTLNDDLRRRDFTINTLALRLDGDHFGELRDDLGGLDDLRGGIIRVLHPHSFVDDPTRILRAVRYEQRYGFRIAPETLALIPEALPLITRLSAERVRHELDLILEEENAAAMLRRLAELEVLAKVHPRLTWNQSIRKRFEKVQEASPATRRSILWTLWLIHLTSGGFEEIESRLHFHANLRDEILAASTLFAGADSLIGKMPSQCVGMLENKPLRAVQAVTLALPPGPVRQQLRNFLEHWRHVSPYTTGRTLVKRGLPPGPAYQKILGVLRDAWLDEEIKTEAEEMDLLEKLIKT